MKIRVIGGGALGMLFSAKLAESGAAVELVTRTPEQAQLIREQGLCLAEQTDIRNRNAESGEAGPTVHVRPATLDFDEAAALAASGNEETVLPDVILLTVKQTSLTEAMAAAIKLQLKPSGRLVCLQNGIGHMELLSRYIPGAQLLTAVTTEGALKLSPLQAVHTGKGTTWVGSEASVILTENEKRLIKNIQNLLSDAGFSIFLSNNITSKVWNKLLINAVINPLTAILQVRNGQLLELPAALVLMRSLYEEGRLLADQLGIETASDLWEQLLEVCRRTANNRSSMLQDVLSRRLTETDAITGGLLDKARSANVHMPAHETIYQLLKSIEQQRESIK